MTKGVPKREALWEPTSRFPPPGLASWGRRGGKVLCRMPAGSGSGFSLMIEAVLWGADLLPRGPLVLPSGGGGEW